MKYLGFISLFLSLQSWAMTDSTKYSIINKVSPAVILPTPIGTPPPSNIEVWSDDWILNTPLEGSLNSSNSKINTFGAVGIKCDSNYSLHDLWLPQVMQIADSSIISLYAEQVGNEDHMDLLQRMFARLDRSIPSLASKLRLALDQMSINYVKGPLATDGLNSLFKSTIPKCKTVRFSHRMKYAYGTEIYIDQDIFFDRGVSVQTRSGIILHELIATLFENEFKSDKEIAFSGIVATILASDFNQKDLLDRVSTFGFTISDTYPYKAIAQYRAKLVKEKSSMLGIMLVNKQNQLSDITQLTQEYARDLRQQFFSVQVRQYSDSYSLDLYMNYQSLSITDQYYVLKDLTYVMDRLFKSQENEVAYSAHAIAELERSNDVYAVEQIRRFHQRIEDINRMMKDQAKLKSKFDSIKRLNLAFIEDINSELLDRLSKIHRFEQEDLKKLPDMDKNILASILGKRDLIFNEVVSDLQ